jgi:hypothetical protein
LTFTVKTGAIHMKKNPLLLIAIGLICLVIGGMMKVAGGPPSADPALAAQCRQSVAARGGDAQLLAQCKETAFATAMTATDANAAARAISSANRGEVGGGMVAMFLIGVGLALLAGGLFLRYGKGGRPAAA